MSQVAITVAKVSLVCFKDLPNMVTQLNREFTPKDPRIGVELVDLTPEESIHPTVLDTLITNSTYPLLRALKNLAK